MRVYITRLLKIDRPKTADVRFSGGLGFLRVYIEEIKRELVRTFEIVRYLGGAGFKGF